MINLSSSCPFSLLYQLSPNKIITLHPFNILKDKHDCMLYFIYRSILVTAEILYREWKPTS